MRLISILIAGLAVLSQSPAEVVPAHFASAAGTPERPAASVVWTGGGRTGIQHFGRKTLPDGAAPADDTVYEIGSITKAFTGILLADMVQNGEVKLETTIGELLPGAKQFSAEAQRITVGQLATHSSGLPRLPGNLMGTVKDQSNPYAHYTPEHLEAFLHGYKPLSQDPKPEYSNLGFGLLGYALATKAGNSYEPLITGRVLTPLGMGDTVITLTESHLARLAPGHADGKVTANWDIPTLAGAGALRSTPSDMSKLLAALLDPPDTRIGRAIRRAREPGMDLNPSARIGFGWIAVKSAKGSDLIWHNGGTGGYRSFIGVIPDAKVGLVVLTNAQTNPDPIAMKALNALVR
jgi:D-alanyl-D-alanine-carboxypeptidase/D-alanyl-D-alanine-endopeptidase